MSNNSKLLLRVALACGFGLVVTACGSDNSSSSNPTPVTVAPVLQENNFGAMFGVDFRAPAMSEPATVNDSDIVPVSLTTEPIAIN